MIQRIRVIGDENWYSFPENLQLKEKHSKLIQIPAMKTGLNALKARGHHRTIKVTLPTDVQTLYFDSEENIVFNDFMLPETRFKVDPPKPSSKMEELVQSFSQIANRAESVKSILSHFMIEKFSAKNKNVESWCSSFEQESLRFELSAEKQIEVFKSCLDDSLLDWFVVCQKKVGINASWETWKTNLIKTYGDSSWKPVNYAFTFQYLSGSYVEYTVKKERLLLELDRQLVPMTILDLIVVGLPSHIQNSLSRNSVTTVDQLREKLKKYEAEDKVFESNTYQNSKKRSPPSPNLKSNKFKSKEELSHKSNSKIFNNNRKSTRSKVPCSICANMGAPWRFHPETDCWYKDNVVKKESNNINIETPSENDEIPKN